MKIIISCGTMQQGGAERVISILTKKFLDKGHEVELLLYYDRPLFYEIDERVKVVIDEEHIGKVNPLKHILWRRNYIKESSPDVIVSFLAPVNMVNIVANMGLKIPIIVADRSDPRKAPSNIAVRLARDILYRFAGGVVLQNERNRAYFKDSIKEKSEVIYNPLDIGEYKGAGLSCEKSKKIVSVGRIIEQKRPELLVNSFNNIHKEFEEYKLVFYGDGDLKGEMERYAKSIGLGEKVEFAGATQNVYESIKDAELFVLCSDYEGMPNALLEAMCVGLPVISTKVSGATDVIKSGENGFLVECGSEEELTMAMYLMLKDDDMRGRLAENAVNLYEKLDSDEIADKWLAFLEKVSKA